MPLETIKRTKHVTGTLYYLRFPLEEFELARALTLGPATHIEFATLGEPRSALLPRFWAYGPRREHIGQRLTTAAEIQCVSRCTVCTDRIRYKVRWQPSVTEDLAQFVAILDTHDAEVMFGCADIATWELLLQFPTQALVLDLYAACDCSGLTLTRRSPATTSVFSNKTY